MTDYGIGNILIHAPFTRPLAPPPPVNITVNIKIKYKLPKHYVVLVFDEKVPRPFWRIAIVTWILLPRRYSENKGSNSDNYEDLCNPQTSCQ